MAREGRKFKICSSCLLLMFTMMIIYFGETTVRRVKDDIKQWSDEELAKKLITQKINLEYNLKKALAIREHFESILFLEIKKYHSLAIDELSEEGLNSLNHIIKEDRIWNAIVSATFRLRSNTQSDKVTKQEWEDTVEYFSYSLNEEDRSKAIKDQKAIFNKISGKKNADTITLNQYRIAMTDFNLFLRKVINSIEALKDQHLTGRLIFKYLSFEIALYNDCHRKTENGQNIDTQMNEKCQDKKETNKFLIWVLEDPGRWQVISESMFNIFDINGDLSIDATEIDAVLLELEFKDITIKAFQEILIHFYERNNRRSISKQDFLQVMDRIRFLLQKYEDEMGNSLNNDDDD